MLLSVTLALFCALAVIVVLGAAVEANAEVRCRKCGWSGMNRDLRHHYGLQSQIQCPRCYSNDLVVL